MRFALGVVSSRDRPARAQIRGCSGWLPGSLAPSASVVCRCGQRWWSASGLTAPESVGRRCAQLRGSGADLASGPRLVHEHWTSGCKLPARRCSWSSGVAQLYVCGCLRKTVTACEAAATPSAARGRSSSGLLWSRKVTKLGHDLLLLEVVHCHRGNVLDRADCWS